MRRDSFGIGTYVHIIKRGTRGSAIVRDDNDRWRFLKLLRYLNDENVPRNWERDISNEHISAGFIRPKHWQPPKPYVSVLAYCLLDNHFHLLVRENTEHGISRFMQRFCTSMSLYFNLRHGERGTLFQGPYKAVVATSDRQLQYLNAYIQVKNAFERLRMKPKLSKHDFHTALTVVSADPFSSLGNFIGHRKTDIIDMPAVRDVLMEPSVFAEFARDVLEGREEYEVVEELE